MAAVHAALLSIARSLHAILNLKKPINPLHREKIVSLHEKVDFIITFLEDYSDKCHGKLDCMGSGIGKAAYQAQDFIDSYLCSVSSSDYDSSSSKANCDAVPLDEDLNMALDRIHFILEDGTKMIKNNDIEEDLRSRAYSSPTDHSSVAKITAKSKSMVVGLDDDLNAIKERLYEDSACLQIIPIVGMGGIGKTTLARRAYEDSRLRQHFDVRIWFTVSLEYQRREIFPNLLLYFHEEADASEARVYQNLIGRRYLIVIDDIWDNKAWDDLKMVLPDDGNGSRILLTTRLSDVAAYAGSSSPPHQMKFLDEDQSWKLLQEKIFGSESCPPQLVEIGRKIARKCGGLPLTISVVAGLLSTDNMIKEDLWENILENISSTEPTIAQHCSKILCLSYDRLPLRLKPCFLYIAAFPEASKINVSKLIKLWVAEGFLKPSDDHSKCLEDVGEEYLDDLVNRSLILVRKKDPDGKLKTVGIHDLLREICVTKAEEQGFLYQVSSKRNFKLIIGENPYSRLSIHYTQSNLEGQIQDQGVRSALFFSNGYSKLRLYLYCRRLSILVAPDIFWWNFLDVIPRLVNLRYIDFDLNSISSPDGFPTSISKLPNLQTIIAHDPEQIYSFPVPYEVWGMPKLRHLIFDGFFGLSYPSDIGIDDESDLQTLETVIDFRFTEEVIKILVNLKKLKVQFNMSHDSHRSWDDFNLSNLFHLQNLEDLEVLAYLSLDTSMIWKHAFPISLKKLTLRGIPLPWENMTIIGSLPNLQVLRMTNIEVTGSSKWTPTEGQFLRLKHFYSSLDHLARWEAEKEHFPSLESLILWEVWSIDEIPCGIGEIDSLQLIELSRCKKSLVDSAKQIKEQQHENGNDAFQVVVSDYDSNEYDYDSNEYSLFYDMLGWENQRSPT